MNAPSRFPPVPLLLLLLALAAAPAFTGCTTNSNPLGDQPYTSDTKVGRYIQNYGPDFTVTQRVQSGTLYEDYVWPAKGIRITAVYETGDIIREEHFTAGTSDWSNAR